uniref:Fibronectin type-III domain-containing protein n=1 Tax=Schistocephalus solidus TaxID=70667 RepID=A0A0X3NVC6_SCHSO
MWTSFLLLHMFGLLVWSVPSQQVLLQPDITWPDARDLDVQFRVPPSNNLRVHWQTQEHDSPHYFEVTLRCNDVEWNLTRSSKDEAAVYYSDYPCMRGLSVEALLYSSFNEIGMRATWKISGRYFHLIDVLKDKSALEAVDVGTVAMPPPTDAKATIFVYPDQTVSLDISFVPPVLKREPAVSVSTGGVSIENITIAVFPETEPMSVVYRKTLKKGEQFTEANQTAGRMRCRMPPVFKLAETYKLVMYTNDVVENSSETRIIMPNFDPRNVASARIIPTSATTIDFHWGDPIFHIDGLKAFQLRGKSSSGEATVKVDSSKRKVRLSNLKPFTNYRTSVVSLYSLDGSANATTDTGVVLTWSAAPSRPKLKSVIVSGPRSIKISWTAPEITNGILGEYSAFCYQPGAGYPERIRNVSAETLSTEVTHLLPNTLYECTVIASTNEISWGQGGGKTPAATWYPVLTWPDRPTEPTNVTVAAVNSTAVQINWTAPEYSNGELEKYRVLVFSSVVGINSRFIDMEPNVYSLVFNGLPPSAKIHLAVQAFTKTMKNGFGGGLGKTSPIMLVTSKKDEQTDMTVAALKSTAVHINSKAPQSSNGEKELRGADSDLVVRSVETVKPSARFQERLNVSPDHQVLVAAVPFTQGEQPNLTHQVQATKTLQKEGFPPAAIAITVCGILSLLALVVGITILVVRRRRTRDLNFNVNLENDDANNNEEDKSDPKNSSDF